MSQLEGRRQVESRGRFPAEGGAALPGGSGAPKCRQCGSPLINRRSNARFCDARCRERYRSPERPFVALDGEGETNPKTNEHIYTLLASGRTERWIGSKQGLDTESCLEFLLSLSRGSSGGVRPIYIWFAMDYDVNMILADIPLKGPNSIETLRATNTVRWRGYRITYIRRKIFRIARGRRRHTSVDIWGFFQSSFEKALDNWGVLSSPIIAEGKAARDGFNKWSLDRIREYNQAELVGLESLAEKLRDATLPLNLPIQSWHGPAALAGSWLRKNKVKEWMNDVPIDPRLQDAAARAYFGGRIDVLGYGVVNPVHHYDIVSAYPAAIANLPNLRKLQWVHQKKGTPRGRLYVARIKWEIPPTYWAPFPWRATNGSIRYPLEGEGWYWNYEVETAIQKYGRKCFRFMESWNAEGEIEYPFHSLINDTFRYRGELKRMGHPSHVPVKLVLNSLYGKMAQTVGKATYYSPIWAGLITSQTRAQLLAVLSDDVVCVMTDSIWSRKPLDIPIGSSLGEWESQDEVELILAEAGLYEASRADGTSSIWQRGFDKKNPVDIRHLVTKWIGGDPHYKPIYKVNRFIGMGLASVTSYPWRQWLELQRAIEPVPFAGTTKRLPLLDKNGKRISREVFTGHLDSDFVALAPRPRDAPTVSAPYKKITLDPIIIEQRLEEECEEE